MKFEYKKDKYVDLGLIVKHGNVQNVVMFWDENNDAASYILEIYRIDWNYEKEGFFEETTIQERKVEVYDYSKGGKVVETDKYLDVNAPAVASGKFASKREWHDPQRNKRSEVTLHEFDEIKPVCTINVERNKYYHSINDLPCGDYIVCLNVENRNGDTFAQSMPYYFHVEDAEDNANKRAGSIARAVVGW